MGDRGDRLSEVAQTLISSLISLLCLKLRKFCFPLPEVSPLFLWRWVGENGRVRVLDEYLLRKETIIYFFLKPVSHPGVLMALFGLWN